MESWPQNPALSNIPESFHPCILIYTPGQRLKSLYPFLYINYNSVGPMQTTIFHNNLKQTISWSNIYQILSYTFTQNIQNYRPGPEVIKLFHAQLN